MLIPTIITLLALHTVRSQRPSSCPDVLAYEKTEKDRWFAVVNLRSREKYREIVLSITLDRPAELLGNSFGDATTSNNMEFLIKNNNYTLQAGLVAPVRFFVKYNGASTIPSVKEINLNGKTICSDTVEQVTSRPAASTPTRRPSTSTSKARPNHDSSTGRPSASNPRPSNLDLEVIRPNITSSRPSNFAGRLEKLDPDIINSGRPTSENIRKPDNHNPNNNQGSATFTAFGEDDDEFFAGDFSSIFNRPPLNSSLSPSRNQCGVIATQARPLISHGEDTEPGQWPWHVALYHSRGLRLMYICGGSLISTSHILTAAHCVTKPRTNRLIKPENIVSYLGKYHLHKFGSEIQDRDIGDIFVHPQYNYTGYYNDIAILRLQEPVIITDFVRPVCLWGDRIDLNEVQGKRGTVVGWGFNEDGQLTNTLIQAKMPIVSLSECLYSNRNFYSQFTSENTFCAGFRNGTTVCNGDSGGGMFLPRRGKTGSKTVWQIRGIVSVGVSKEGKFDCDPSQFVVFSDVAKHLAWIYSVLKKYP